MPLFKVKRSEIEILRTQFRKITVADLQLNKSCVSKVKPDLNGLLAQLPVWKGM